MASVYSDWDKFVSVACSMIGKDRDFSRLRYFTNRSLRWPSCQTKWTTIRDRELKALSVEVSKQYFSINRQEFNMKKQYRLEPNSDWGSNNVPRGFVNACSHPGPCDEDVKRYSKKFIMTDEDCDYLKNRLVEYGLDDQEVVMGWDQDTVKEYTLWMMACDIKENGHVTLD